MTTNIHIFGDSLMKGTIVRDNWRYKATMSGRIDEFCAGRQLCVSNHSRFGITVDKGRELLDDELEEGLHCEYVLIEFGGNDCNFDWEKVAAAPEKDHQPFTPLDRFKKVYRGMVETVKRMGAKPLLMTLPPINAGLYLDYLAARGIDKNALLRWLGDKEMLYRWHELYSQTVARIAREAGAILLDIRQDFLATRNYFRMIGPDGLHLNPAGYDLLMRALNREYEKLSLRQALA